MKIAQAMNNTKKIRNVQRISITDFGAGRIQEAEAALRQSLSDNKKGRPDDRPFSSCRRALVDQPRARARIMKVS